MKSHSCKVTVRQSQFLGLYITAPSVRIGRLGTIVMVVLGIGAAGAANGAEQWKERLLSEAPKAWAGLEEFGSELEGSWMHTLEVTKAPDATGVGVVRRARIDFLINGSLVWVRTRILEDKRIKEKKVETVLGANSRYAFHLVHESPDTPWRLNWIGKPSEEFYKESMAGKLFKYIRGSWSMDVMPLSRVLMWDACTINQVTAERRGDKNMVRVAFGVAPVDDESVRRIFEYSIPKEILKKLSGAGQLQTFMTVRDAWLVLDPDNHWRIQEFQRKQWDRFHQVSVEYGEKISGVPMVQRLTYVTHGPGGDSLETCEFDRLVHRKAPESEFTLAAFGLQEAGFPTGLPPEPNHLSRWLLLCAAVLAILAGAVGWYWKKKGLLPTST